MTLPPIIQPIRQWIKLGHWKRRNWLGRQLRSEYLSLADGPAFFLAPNGVIDPRAELRATLLAFAQPLNAVATQAQHPQCLFPARRRWAFQYLHWDKVLAENNFPMVACDERREWKKKLDAEGLSLVYASTYLNNAASMFGHTFLKFHARGNREGRELLDYGVNFAAETGSDGGVPFALYGLTGGYRGLFSLQPFHQTLREYSNLEGRDLWEYRIDLTKDEIEFFVDHLFELERTWFDYYFLEENCSFQLLAALEAVRPNLELLNRFWYEVIPGDSVRVVAEAPGLIKSTRYRPSLTTIFEAQLREADESSKDFAHRVVDLGEPLATEETQALDLAIDLGAIRAAKKTEMFADLNHRLRAQRASLGGSPTTVKIEEPKRPEEGHKSGRLSFLAESSAKRMAAERDLDLGLQIRFAYHDRLSLDDGYLRGTTLEVMKVTGFKEPGDDARLRLRELILLNILSAHPWDRFKKPLAWRFSFGFDEPLASQSLGPFVSGGAGGTLALKGGDRDDWLWLTAFVDGRARSNPDLDKQTPIDLGPRILATIFAHHRLKFGVDHRWLWSINGGPNSIATDFELVWAPLNNIEFRLGHGDEYSTQDSQTFGRSKWTAMLSHFVLF